MFECRHCYRTLPKSQQVSQARKVCSACDRHPLPKYCPSCGKLLTDWEADQCSCGSNIHTEKACVGCENYVMEGYCAAYRETGNPIMREDGTCLGYREVKNG